MEAIIIMLLVAGGFMLSQEEQKEFDSLQEVNSSEHTRKLPLKMHYAYKDGNYILSEKKNVPTQKTLLEIKFNSIHTENNKVTCHLQPIKIEFDNNDARLNEKARQDVESSLGYAKMCGVKSIQVQGYASRTGTFSYNLELSKKRALSVKELLERKGNYPVKTITAKDESELYKETPQALIKLIK